MMIEVLFAQDPAPAGGAGAGQSPFLGPQMFFLLAIFALFYVVVLLPAGRRQKKEQAAMLAAIKRGTKVVTTSGIIGTVVSVKETEDEITLRSDESKLKVLKSSVLKVLGSDEAEAGK